MSEPLLTVAIPTWNRAPYLARALGQLRDELTRVDANCVEVLVSDNCSTDDTAAVVQRTVADGCPIRYVRNDRNVGWALNFTQAFQLARGEYVLLMGDDDLLVDGTLRWLVDRLRGGPYGVVCLRPYGFNEDFRAEHPGGRFGERVFTDSNAFLRAIGRYFTLTSANVINKSLVSGVDVRQFIHTNLATFHLLLRAALSAPRNLFAQTYLVASKRQNSFAYEYSDVFVRELWEIIDAHVAYGLSPATIRALERQKILTYYPFYLFDLRLSNRGDVARARSAFASRFGGRLLFRCWLDPVLSLPRPLAIAWGAATTLVGRVASGDLRRGAAFARDRVRNLVLRNAPRVPGGHRTSVP